MTPPIHDALRGRRVLVTGATGLVGGAVVSALLAAGATAIVLVRDADRRSYLYRSRDVDRCVVVAGTLEDPRIAERAVVESEADTVIHLAAQPIVGTALRAPLATFEANIRGTYNLLDACRVHADLVRSVVVASSDKAYGDQGGAAYSEVGPLAARHPYDVSKACADMLAQAYAATYEMPIAIARCGNIFGPGDLNWNRLIPGTIRALFREERPLLRSDGTMVRDYIYVKDVADAYLLLASQAAEPANRGQAYNFSAGSPLTVFEVVGRIGAAMGKAHLAPVVEASARHEIPRQVLSTDKARTALGWAAQHEFDEGLRETINWYSALLAEQVT